MMQRNQKLATVLSLFTLAIGVAISSIIYTFLPFEINRINLSIGFLMGSVVSALVVFLGCRLLPDRRRWQVLALLPFALFIAIIVGSFLMPRITFARFGFTVYGGIPIPIVDITINKDGILWFRAKTHQITRAEIESLMDGDVEIVIVGIGWDSIARLTEEAAKLSSSVDLRVLPTPDAFDTYNSLKRAGRRVVLLAHTTC